MKIIILNGSPKGLQSVTMRYIQYIEKKFPENQYEILNIAQLIKKIEKDENTFNLYLEKIKKADGVIWAFPLYIMLVIAQYKKFIELIFEKKAESAFQNKYAAILTTSIKFFDYTAHNYMEAICNDLKMNFVDTFSAKMYELTKKETQRQLENFAQNLFHSIKSKAATFKKYKPLIKNNFKYIPGKTNKIIDTQNKKILILTDSSDPNTNQVKMLNQFKNHIKGKIKVIDLNDIQINGGCMGCIQCGYEKRCAYTGKDQFIDFYRGEVKNHDIIVYAGHIVDRYLSSRWKLYYDRRFCETHTPVLPDKQFVYIISGPLSQLPHLQNILELEPQLAEANLAGIITDEPANSQEIDKLIYATAEKTIKFSIINYKRPKTFLGVGGLKIFRDDIFAELRFPFKADYKYYKKHAYFDFPQKEYKFRIFSFIMLSLCKIPGFRKKVYQKMMKSGMVKPLDKILNSI